MKSLALTLAVMTLLIIGVSFYFVTQIVQPISKNRYQQNTTNQSSLLIQNPFESTLPSCGSNKTLFSVFPVPFNKIVDLAPLGQMTPPDHVLPAPHTYIYVLSPDNPQDIEVPVYAPGDMTLKQIEIHSRPIGQVIFLWFSPCKEFDFYFINLRSLKYQPFIDAEQQILSNCNLSSQGVCFGSVRIPVKAGELIATTGDIKSGVYGVDVGARDYRLPTGRSNFINPDRYCAQGEQQAGSRCYTVCPYDYFTDDIRKQLNFTGQSGKIVRTEEPVCGSVYYDVKDSAQGNWFRSGQNQSGYSPEYNYLFLGPDNVKPVKLFSVGNTAGSLPTGRYEFISANSGMANLDFKNVTANGMVYCYETNSFKGNGIIIIQLTSSTTLRIEKLNTASCGSGPWSFTSNAVDFQR